MTQHYVGTKVIQAYENEKDGQPGYAVQYPDGYTSWSPKDVFEEAYLPVGVIPAGTPDFVQRMIAERVQLNDRTTKLRAFYNEAEQNDGHPDLQGDELEDVQDQLGWMVDYLETLDQRIQRHGFVFHDTGRLFTTQQAQVKSYIRIEEIIYPIIAGFVRKGGLMDLHAARDIPKAISEKIFREFEVSTVVECSFENDYWNVKVRGQGPFGGTDHVYKLRYLECHHRAIDKLLGSNLNSAIREVSAMGTANDVVFMSYVSDIFHRTLQTAGVENLPEVKGQRINGSWALTVDYNDALLKNERFYYSTTPGIGAPPVFISNNTRQARFNRLLAIVWRMKFTASEAILNKLNESIVEPGYTGPKLVTPRGVVVKAFKDEALERLQQMVDAVSADRGEKN